MALDEALNLGQAAWEDGGTLWCVVSLAAGAKVACRVRVEVDAVMRGPKPNTEQLLVVFPVRAFDLELEAGLEVARANSGVFRAHRGRSSWSTAQKVHASWDKACKW